VNLTFYLAVAPWLFHASSNSLSVAVDPSSEALEFSYAGLSGGFQPTIQPLRVVSLE